LDVFICLFFSDLRLYGIPWRYTFNVALRYCIAPYVVCSSVWVTP